MSRTTKSKVADTDINMSADQTSSSLLLTGHTNSRVRDPLKSGFTYDEALMRAGGFGK